jgi:hypothetical protein
MDLSGIEWAARVSEVLDSLLSFVGAALNWLGKLMSELQARYPQLFSPQTLFGLIGSTIAIWKWWESREANLFRRFEEMIARNEAQLVKAHNDLLDVMMRPGPGVRIRPPLFVEKTLRLVLMRRRWHPSSLIRLGEKIDQQLERAVETCNRKVAAHQARLSFYRHEIAAARLVQGAVAGGRATSTAELSQRQLFEQEALDRFRAVLAMPGHEENPTALELVAHQLAQMEPHAVAAINAHTETIDTLENLPASPKRNLALARAKRSLAVLRYRMAPGVANGLLVQASLLLTQFGPRRDRDLLELAETLTLEGITRFRLGMVVLGPQRLSEAHGHYRDLLRSLKTRRRGLFDWMFRTRLYAGHRVKELRQRTLADLAFTEHLITLTNRYPSAITANLQRGRGVRRRNRKPLPLPRDH